MQAGLIHQEGFHRIRLDVTYDGTHFFGWAKQPQLRTVQGTLERALEHILRAEQGSIRLHVAGRTDAGVHATGQVAHVDLPACQWASLNVQSNGQAQAHQILLRRINGFLGQEDDVLVLGVQEVSHDFDARFSALWRRYCYRIADVNTRYTPLMRFNTVRVQGDLDLDLMNEASSMMLGLRDFGAFCKPREGATTVRTLQRLLWKRDEHGVIHAMIQADAFCHNMVRSLMGAYVEVGRGRLSLRDLRDLQEVAQRTSRFRVMPAAGLTLVEVKYPQEAFWQTRSRQTQARRDG